VRHTDHARVFADFDLELPGIPLVVPPSVLRPSEKHSNLVGAYVLYLFYHADVLAATVEMRSMAAAQGERLPGEFMLIAGLDSIRYAVRPQKVGIIHDADKCHDETTVQLQWWARPARLLLAGEVLVWFA
jgi:hypothetical protein